MLPFKRKMKHYLANLLYPNQITGGDTSNNTDGFAGSNATVSRDLTKSLRGAGSIKVATNNANPYESGFFTANGLIPGKTYIATVNLCGSGTVVVTTGSYQTGEIVIGATFKPYSMEFVATIAAPNIAVLTTTKQAAVFYMDGLRLKAK